MAVLSHINDYTPKKEDKFFLDTNIWMYLYCSIGNYRANIIDSYNSFYEKILEADSEIFTTSLQVSEFFNSYCRLEFNIAKQEDERIKEFKRDFRNSKLFQDTLEEINLILSRRILKTSKKLDDDFSKTNIDELIKQNDEFDFNDEYFLNLCEKNNIIVVSNDRDILKSDRDIKIVSKLVV